MGGALKVESTYFFWRPGITSIKYLSVLLDPIFCAGYWTCLVRFLFIHFWLIFQLFSQRRPRFQHNESIYMVQRLIKSTCGVYCNIMFHVAEAKIIRHIDMVFHVETLAHFSIKRKSKSVGEKWSIG